MSVETLLDAAYAESVDARLASSDAYVEYQMREAQRALPFLGKFFQIQGARVLEIGAGRGGKGIAYAQAGMRLTALDVDQPALKIAADSARRRGAPIQFLIGDGAGLALPENFFDAILLDSVIEHTREPSAVLAECWRVLKPGGIVLVVFPPWYGPLSGHIDDFVMIPWFHLLPRQIVENYLLAKKQAIGILAPRDAFEVFLSLNHLTIFRFRQFARRAGFRLAYARVRPFLTHPGMRLAVGLVSAFRHAPRWEKLRAAFARARREFSLGSFLLFLLLGAISPLVFVPLAQEVAVGGYKCVLKK